MKKWMMVLLSLCLSLSPFTACSNQEENEEATASPTAAATATPTAESAETPESTSEATPTTAPEEDPDADPEVDAMLFRFWTEGEYGWINIDSAGDTGLPSDSLVIGVQLEYEDEAGLKIIAQTGDPYFLIVPASDMGEYFSLADYPVLKIRMRNETPSTVGELFINRSGANNVTADDEIQYDITANDTEFKEYIIDLKELMGEEFVSAGEVSALRLDVVNLADVEDPTAEDAYADGEPYTVYIDYLGFFKTVEDAEAWNPAHLAAAETPTAAPEA